SGHVHLVRGDGDRLRRGQLEAALALAACELRGLEHQEPRLLGRLEVHRSSASSARNTGSAAWRTWPPTIVIQMSSEGISSTGVRSRSPSTTVTSASFPASIEPIRSSIRSE